MGSEVQCRHGQVETTAIWRTFNSAVLTFEIDPASDVIYIGSPHVVLKYNLRPNKLEIFHQMNDGKKINGRKHFEAYRRNLVMIPDFRA